MESPLTTVLRRCARVCEDTLESYGGQEEATGTEFVSSLMLAVAGIERAVAAEYDEPTHDAALVIAATLCRDAAGGVRNYGLDPTLLRCADACERAAYLCEAALARSG